MIQTAIITNEIMVMDMVVVEGVGGVGAAGINET